MDQVNSATVSILVFICGNTNWGRSSSAYVNIADACLSSLLSICIYRDVQNVAWGDCTYLYVLGLALSMLTHMQPHLLTVDYLILWSCPLFLEWLAHLQDCKCGNTPCDLTPAILARLLQTFSHADLIKYSIELSQRKLRHLGQSISLSFREQLGERMLRKIVIPKRMSPK